MKILREQYSKYHRFNIPGHAHDLTFSCYQRRPFLKNDKAKLYLVDTIKYAQKKHHFDIWAFVIMPEHVHILIYPLDEEYSISEILKSIKQPVARKVINTLRNHNPQALKYFETGLRNPAYRFWQDGGGYDRNYWSKDEILKQIDYIHHNPLRRGSVDNPGDWLWSSAREWLNDEKGVIEINKDSLFNRF